MPVNASLSAVLGVAFAILGTATVGLMFHLWGYPFDKATRTSAAPRSLMRVHRVLGYLFVGLYVFMMIQMVPRLLRYQVEFPARTVVHMMLGITIGFLLIVKISIIRWFRHLEEWMPYLGTGMLLSTYLLIGMSVPFSFRERQLRARALGGDAASAASLLRLVRILPEAGLPKEAPLSELATAKGVLEGREVLLTQCVHCHDLKTIFVRPRPPKDWVDVVGRMADKPVFDDEMTSRQQWAVATYLIAISPDLQLAAKKARAQKVQANDARATVAMVMEAPAGPAPVDLAAVKPLFDAKCTECHDLDDMTKHKWQGEDDVKEVLTRMVDNGLEASPRELDALKRYVLAVYANGSALAAPSPSVLSTAASLAASAAIPASPPSTPSPVKSKKPATGVARAIGPAAATTTAPPPAASLAPPTDGTTCGVKPLPDCPMQRWMKSNAAGALASEDLAAVAASFAKIAALAPPGFGSWASIAAEGAAAAKGGNLQGARAACSSCHTQYRGKYKSENRARPL